MGKPTRAPSMWPGVPGARERAIWAGRQVGIAEFQQEGAAFLAERDYALLCDAMGQGKTCQAITAAEARLSMAAIPTPKTPVALIVCPAVAKRVWQAELKKWIGAESVVLDSLRPDPEQLTERYVICNYDILYGGQKRDAAGVVYDVAHLPGWAATLANRFLITIFDEAHVLRGRSSRRTKTAKLLCKGVPVVWALTGTPMPNYVRDLYSLVDVISDGIFGFSYWKWAQGYAGAAQGQYGWTDKGSSRLDELQARLGYFTLGRTAEMVHLQLPEKRREVVKIDVEVSAPTVHEGLQALDKKQAVMSALRATANAKRPAVVNAAVEALEAKQKVIVFVYMRAQADAIAKDIRKRVDCTVFCVHGDLSPDGRYAQSQQFREASAPACFVATIDSMGVALSLVGAHLMIFGDVVPEPWKMLQAEKRGHRFDSVVRLLVRYFIATGTVDEGIAEAVIAKLPVIEQALGTQDDSNEMVKLLGGRSDEEIVGALFAKLQSWSANG
jgi:SWI/SNF-related matrix-associated actin-dependent regulator 1 of chromatin subfamily A